MKNTTYLVFDALFFRIGYKKCVIQNLHEKLTYNRFPKDAHKKNGFTFLIVRRLRKKKVGNESKFPRDLNFFRVEL